MREKLITISYYSTDSSDILIKITTRNTEDNTSTSSPQRWRDIILYLFSLICLQMIFMMGESGSRGKMAVLYMKDLQDGWKERSLKNRCLSVWFLDIKL